MRKASEKEWRPGKVPVKEVWGIRSPAASHGLHSGTVVVGRVEPKT
jgi:hypothetical protein